MNDLFMLALTGSELTNVCLAIFLVLLFIFAVFIGFVNVFGSWLGTFLFVLLTAVTVVGTPVYLIVDHIWLAPKDERVSDWHILTGKQAMVIYAEAWEDLLAIGSDEWVKEKRAERAAAAEKRRAETDELIRRGIEWSRQIDAHEAAKRKADEDRMQSFILKR